MDTHEQGFQLLDDLEQRITNSVQPSAIAQRSPTELSLNPAEGFSEWNTFTVRAFFPPEKKKTSQWLQVFGIGTKNSSPALIDQVGHLLLAKSSVPRITSMFYNTTDPSMYEKLSAAGTITVYAKFSEDSAAK